MANKESQAPDSVFGQSRAFALTDPLVDPAVVAYLSTVRQEALRTSTISPVTMMSLKLPKHNADMYDDVQESSLLTKPPRIPAFPEKLLAFQRNMDNWIQWFKHSKETIWHNGYIFEGYNTSTLDLLLHYLKKYLEAKKEKKGLIVHLLNILKDHPEINEDSEFLMDEDWLEATLNKLKTKKIKNLNDIKNIIGEGHKLVPNGFKQWYQYITENEPSHSIFKTVVNDRNIWVLVQFYSKEWIKDIYNNKKRQQVVRFSQWLLYIIIHLPTNLTADYISILRTLGKKCQKNVNDIAHASDHLTETIVLTDEMKLLGIQEPPGNPSILELALSVISEFYGQRDLTDWEHQL